MPESKGCDATAAMLARVHWQRASLALPRVKSYTCRGFAFGVSVVQVNGGWHGAVYTL